MGYGEGTTWTPTITDTDRHVMVRRAMDATCLEFLLSMCQVLHFRNVSYIVFKAKTRPPIDTLQKERAPKKPL
jgi:hypothetical protein